MYFFIFDRPPQALDENIVEETAASVHRNRHASRDQPSREGLAGELTALIRVENPRRAISRKRFVERVDAKARVHRVRQSPRQNRPAGPVDDRHEIEKAMLHRNIGDVGRPNMIGLRNRHAAQQIGINLVPRGGLARAGARNQRDDSHQSHQPLHVLAIDLRAFLVEFQRHSPRAVKRQLEMQFVDAAHQREIVRRRRGFGPVDARTRQRQQLALAPHGKIALGRINHGSSIRHAHRPDLLAKKSRSTVSSPILA